MESKLPKVGTTIFTVMSQMATQTGAINLSQGFPDFPVAPALIDRVYFYMQQRFNQYAPMPGTPQLRKAIAHKVNRLYPFQCEAADHVTVTAGGTEAIFCAIQALIRKDEEAIILEPAYDCYQPAIELAGGVCKPISLEAPDFQVPWDQLEAAVNEHTRLLIINTPHNPTGAVWSADDMNALQQLLKKHPNLYVLSDEVYEHIIFDAIPHQSILRYPDIIQRGIAVFSFGKTFHATGWKSGYMIAPEEITKEIRKVHQFVTFSVHTPTQMAIADYIQEPTHYEYLPQFYQEKRDAFLKLMKGSRFKSVPCHGTYFQLFDYSEISDRKEFEMAEWLTKEKGVASIPVSAFYEDKKEQRLLRFCFAKGEETLQKAAAKLCEI